MSIIAIVAVDENNGIGYQGELLVRIPEDMKRFKELTTDHTVIMGRKTYESIHLLPNRNNMIIRRGETVVCAGRIPYGFFSLEDAIGYIQRSPNADIYVIGGASIYEQLLPLCDTVELTRIYKAFEKADAYFPLLDSQEWEQVAESELKEYNGLQYQFITYKRI